MANRVLVEIVSLLIWGCSGQPEPGLGNSGGSNGTSIGVGGATPSTGGTFANTDGGAGGYPGSGGANPGTGGTLGLGGNSSPTGGSLNSGGTISGLGGTTGTCAVGTADCDGLASNGCEVDLRTNLQHCGSCGNFCGTVHGLSTCVAGVCDSNECWPFANCDSNYANGCETNLQTSPQNCGTCGSVCASGVCAAGVCQPSI